MRWPIGFVLLVAISAASFAAGALWQVKRSDDEAREFPCIVRFWNPNQVAFVQTNVADEDCLKLEHSKQYSGVWIDAPVGADFISTDPSLPKDVQLSLSPYLRAEIYKRAGVQAMPWATTKLRYEITVTGKLGRYPSNPRVVSIDGAANKIVVGDIRSAKRITPTPPS